MKVVIAGGSGLIGATLIRKLTSEGCYVILLTRHPLLHPSLKHPLVETVGWDAKTIGVWRQNVENVFAVVNLAGESIASHRWNERQKQKIVSSRLDATRALIQTISEAKIKTEVFINASAVGFYGNVVGAEVDEAYPAGSGFLSEVARMWEEAALEAEQIGVRTIRARIGVVLSRRGGVLPRMILPYRLFAGGPLGNGNQWIPWIHIEDVARALIYAIKERTVNGAINVTSPHPVQMNEFAVTLGKVLHRPSHLRLPNWMLKFVLGEMSSLLLEGQRAVPLRLLNAGFTFEFPDLQSALLDCTI